MSCEYAKGKDPLKCELTARPCLVISDQDRTAYRHCLAREWKHNLAHAGTEPAPSRHRAGTEPAPSRHRAGTEPAPDCLVRKLLAQKTPQPGRGDTPGPAHAGNSPLTTPPPSLTNL